MAYTKFLLIKLNKAFDNSSPLHTMSYVSNVVHSLCMRIRTWACIEWCEYACLDKWIFTVRLVKKNRVETEVDDVYSVTDV